MSKFEGLLHNFQCACHSLAESIDDYRQFPHVRSIQDGMIQRFELTYDLAWKTVREYLVLIGIVEIHSPKAVLKEAYIHQLIHDEEHWLMILKDRSYCTYFSQTDGVNEMVRRVVDIYSREFEELLANLNELHQQQQKSYM